MVILGVGMAGRKNDQHARPVDHPSAWTLSGISLKRCPRSG
jgi:hypothetical protein